MKVMITGGAGYLGTELVAAVASKKELDEIVVFDNLSRPNHGFFTAGLREGTEKIVFVQGDMLDAASLKAAADGADVIVHLAAKVSTPYADVDPHSYEQVNHWGTAELVSIIEDMPKCSLIHLSTTSVYGLSSTPIDESTEPNPTISYGLSKLRGEKHVRRIVGRPNARTVIIRAGNVFGFSPSMRFEAVVNRFAFDAKYKGRLQVHGDGSQNRPFIEIREITAVIERMIFDAAVPSGVYNASGGNISVAEIAGAFKSIYPDLEIQRLNQHLKYGSLLLRENPLITETIKPIRQPLEGKLRGMLERLSM